MEHDPLVNNIPFPTYPSSDRASSQLSLSPLTMRATALDVCHSVYGDNEMSDDAVARFYDPNASEYENPVLTATSRFVISDIHRLSRKLSSIDVHRPLAVLCTLLRIRPFGFFSSNSEDPLFQALKVWIDVGDISEGDGLACHRKVIVEHTLNILLLPGIHCDSATLKPLGCSKDSVLSVGESSRSRHLQYRLVSPSLPIPGTLLSIPSPLHFRLPILTRLCFNEQGLVTHHRDVWDIKDVMGLIPGVSLTQWVGTRLAAVGLSYAGKLMMKRTVLVPHGESALQTPRVLDRLDLEHGERRKTQFITSTSKSVKHR